GAGGVGARAGPRAPVGRGAGLHVVRRRFSRGLRNGGRRLVSDADDRGPGGGEPAGEEGHLGRVPGRDHDDVHGPSSTRTVVTSRRSASVTTAVSGCRTITYPSPS